MSTAVEEITDLEGIGHDDPKCDIKDIFRDYAACGMPSVVRLKFTCVCGEIALRFACQECYSYIRSARIACGICTRQLGYGLYYEVI